MPEFPSPRSTQVASWGAISTVQVLGLSTLATTSTAWPAANQAVFVPFRLNAPVTIKQLVIGAGATATGNFDVGIYDAEGNLLRSSGATAKGNATEQVIDIADLTIGPGLYYLALSADGTINFRVKSLAGTAPIPAQKARMLGVLEMATAYPLPTTATFAACTSGVTPLIAAYFLPY